MMAIFSYETAVVQWNNQLIWYRIWEYWLLKWATSFWGRIKGSSRYCHPLSSWWHWSTLYVIIFGSFGVWSIYHLICFFQISKYDCGGTLIDPPSPYSPFPIVLGSICSLKPKFEVMRIYPGIILWECRCDLHTATTSICMIHFNQGRCGVYQQKWRNSVLCFIYDD